MWKSCPKLYLDFLKLFPLLRYKNNGYCIYVQSQKYYITVTKGIPHLRVLNVVVLGLWIFHELWLCYMDA